jgi:hypothetical protein
MMEKSAKVPHYFRVDCGSKLEFIKYSTHESRFKAQLLTPRIFEERFGEKDYGLCPTTRLPKK